MALFLTYAFVGEPNIPIFSLVGELPTPTFAFVGEQSTINSASTFIFFVVIDFLIGDFLSL